MTKSKHPHDSLILALARLSKLPAGTRIKKTGDLKDSRAVDLINLVINRNKKAIAELEKKVESHRKRTVESERAKGQIRESMGEILKFQKLSEAISTSHNIGQVIDALDSLSGGIIPIKGSGVFLLDRHVRSLIALRTKNLNAATLKIIHEQFEEGIIDWVMGERCPAVIPDIHSPSAGELSISETNFIIIPLIVHGRGIGVYHIHTEAKKSDFTLQQLEILALLSNEAGVAIENSQLYEQMNRTIKELAVLYETGKQIAVLQPNQVYRTAVQTLCGKLSASAGWILEANSAGEMQLRAAHGVPEIPLNTDEKALFGEVVKKGEAFLLDSIQLRRFPGLMGGRAPAGFMAAPFFLRGTKGGIIALARESGQEPFDPFHVRLLRTLSTQISSSVENSKLYQELIQSNRNLTDMQGQLAHSSRLATIGELAGRVAHEINNPLQIILGRVQMVIMETGDSARRKELEIIESETKRIAGIVHQLLEAAKQRQREVQFERVDLNQILRDSLCLISRQIEDQNISIEEEYESSLGAIKGNTGMLKQVFLNLCLNAMQAMPKGGRLKVQSHRDGQWVCAECSDTGCGIAQENLGKIFNPFFTTHPESGGTGLGLSICRDLVEKHQGQVTVASKPGYGSVFTVRLPLMREVG